MLAMLALGVGVLVSSCCSCRKASPKMANLEEASWKLIEYQGQAVPSDKAVTLTFDPQKKMVYGKAPCNNFFGGYTLTDGKDSNISFAGMGSTRMFCPDTEIEDGLTRSMSDITRVKMDGNNLLLLDGNGNMVALFAPVDRLPVND